MNLPKHAPIMMSRYSFNICVGKKINEKKKLQLYKCINESTGIHKVNTEIVKKNSHKCPLLKNNNTTCNKRSIGHNAHLSYRIYLVGTLTIAPQ